MGQPHPTRSFPAAGTRQELNIGLFWSLAFAIRRQSFERIGGFDERFVGYGAEDTDFGFSAQRAGLPLIFVGGIPVFHQHHDGYDPPLQHFESIVLNAQLFHRKWHFWPMRGWLDAMAAIGLISFDDVQLRLLRMPELAEIQNSKKLGRDRF